MYREKVQPDELVSFVRRMNDVVEGTEFSFYSLHVYVRKSLGLKMPLLSNSVIKNNDFLDEALFTVIVRSAGKRIAYLIGRKDEDEEYGQVQLFFYFGKDAESPKEKTFLKEKLIPFLEVNLGRKFSFDEFFEGVLIEENFFDLLLRFLMKKWFVTSHFGWFFFVLKKTYSDVCLKMIGI